MTALERLARRICWMGFIGEHYPPGGEAGYWKRIHQDARDEYIHEARQFIWLKESLGRFKSSTRLYDEARLELGHSKKKYM